jgi:hypothetical protein
MATNITPVSQQDIDAVDDLLKELKARAAASHKDGKMLIHGVYTDLINLVSPTVVRLHARVEREDRASNNKLFKESKKTARNGQASA